jgi:hypothetical protein
MAQVWPASLLLLPLLLALPGNATDYTNARVFITNTGDDARCGPQPVIAGRNANLINPPTIACRTIQRGCDIALGIPMVHVAPAAGIYIENFVCRIGGTDARHPAFFHIAEQVQPLGPVWMTGVPGTGKPIGEFTGSHVRAGGAGMHFDGNDGDGVYVHGMDAAHPADDFQFYYGTAVTHNRGRGVHVSYTTNFLLTGGAVFNNLGDCVFIENSPGWKIYAEAIFRCGSVTGSPTTPVVGTNVSNSPNGWYISNKGNRESSPTVRLVNSPHVQVTGNFQPLPQFPPFSIDVSPSSDLATDIISGN